MTTIKPANLLLALAFCCAISPVQAQGPGGPDPDPSIPFDGGLSLVVAAGIVYIAKKGYDKRKKLTQDKTAEE